MIYITGDIHGIPGYRFNTHNFPEQKEMTKDDFVIICGDFGLVWDYTGESAEERYWLDWLDDKPFTTLFVSGNHENFDRLYEYPIVDFHGGKAQQISKSVYHLVRGNVYKLCGKKFFAFGGASSHDIFDGILDPASFNDEEEFKKTMRQWYNQGKMFRIKGMSWWERELPTQEEMDFGLKTLVEHNNTVDFIVTHCAPQQVASLISRGFYKADILTSYFDTVAEDVKFEKWFFGHYHDNQQIMGKFQLLYEDVIRIV